MEHRATMKSFSHEHFPAFQQAAARAMSMVRSHFRYQRGKVPVEEALDLICSFPTPETPYDTWHQLAMLTLVQDATDVCCESSSGASLDGETLLNYYMSLLKKHFEPQRCNAKLLEYARLAQGDLSPVMYLQQVRLLLPYVKRKYGEPVIADRYVNGLQPDVRERIMAKYCTIDSNDWYDQLDGIALDAERIWLNSQNLQAQLEDKAPRELKEPTRLRAVREISNVKTVAKHHCSYHGSNSTHDSKDCRVINGQRSAASTSVERSENSLAIIIEQLKTALATDRTDKSTKSSPRIERIQRNPGAAGGSRDRELPVCAYCEKPGHNERSCFIQHPDKAPSNFKAPTRALQHLYEQNLERLQRGEREHQEQAKPIRAAAVVAAQPDDEEEEV